MVNILTQIYQTVSSLLRCWWFFRKKTPRVAILGSARFLAQNVYSQKAYQLSRQLAQKGYCILTGGGHGIMEAASRGARDGGGVIVGCYVRSLEPVNAYLSKLLPLDSLKSRQTALIQYSEALMIFPGGFGTLDELLGALVCAQNKQKNIPIFLVGSEFWNPLLYYFKESLLAQHQTIDRENMDSIFIADSVEEILAHLDSLHVLES